MSPALIQRRRLEFQYRKDGIPTASPPKPKPWFPRVPSILCMQHRNPILGYSKAPWGLSVLSRVTGIFTGTTISPGGLLRQCPDHYAFHAGQNLPDKEFRYLRTVIVTAAVYWGFDSGLSLLLLTFQHRAGVTPYTSSFDLAESCVFAKQLPGPILCGSVSRAPLLPLALESSSYLPVSVCGTGISNIHRAFLASIQVYLPYSDFGPFRPGLPTPGMYPSTVSLCLNPLMATESPPYVHRLRLSASP